MTMQKHRGVFRICASLIDKEPWLVRCILSRVITVRAEMNYMTDSIEYHAIGDVFDEAYEGCVTPIYDVIIDDINGVTFKKQK